MTRVRFAHAGFELDVARGARILDVTDDHPEADVTYSCRSASCGTCRVEILEGAAAFARADEDEAGVLELYGDTPNVRLACQLRLTGDVERVVLRVAED